MSTKVFTIQQSDPTNYDVHITTWLAMGAGDVGDPLKMPESSDRTIQFEGTFDGTTATFEGSLDKVNWETLHDPQGAAISLSAPGIRAVMELVLWIRPKTAGGTAPNVTAMLLTKKAR